MDWVYVDKEHVLKVVENVYQLFQSKSNWIDYPIAANDLLQEMGCLDPNATKWNLLGAIDKESHKLYPELAQYVACATRDFLNTCYKDNLLWKSYPSYSEEIKVLKNALKKLIKN